MRKIFVADAHLRDPQDLNYRTLVRFLDTLPPDTDTLYLLGDLFEFWIGNPDPVYRHYREFVDCLKGVRQRGVRIVYFEGNHDFHLERFFKEQLGAEVHDGAALVEIAGRRVYLCHGDEVNRDDHGYRVFRGLLRHPLVKALVPIFPQRLACRLAEFLSRRSRGQHVERASRWDYRTILESFARERFAQGCDVVITGHFHLPIISRVEGKTLICLGDWISQFSYAQCLDGEFTLETFS
ncbi:UDP-2,3-diacylglucosamine hydrolase [Geomonas silvestris]|uniref:UDP-2,3-diacylglucosamine hydrolase n=1 Tax=Geomonas silvestris TaxID=2740184 RepID=A0A6V8MIP2_9BACT|nr:UDP-2,3-diacylglucosamine diphosphatase [Geomonas silvestris]GFO59807.1 UDP-2,3-diacylglucosamine hydrolase [Geomonas silvestris]